MREGAGTLAIICEWRIAGTRDAGMIERPFQLSDRGTSWRELDVGDPRRRYSTLRRRGEDRTCARRGITINQKLAARDSDRAQQLPAARLRDRSLWNW